MFTEDTGSDPIKAFSSREQFSCLSFDLSEQERRKGTLLHRVLNQMNSGCLAHRPRSALRDKFRERSDVNVDARLFKAGQIS